MVWGPSHEECQEFHGICIQDEMVTAKINAQASAPISHPPCCELAISRTKRGGVEIITAGHIPLHQTFHPLSIQEALGKVCMKAQSFLFIHPR